MSENCSEFLEKLKFVLERISHQFTHAASKLHLCTFVFSNFSLPQFPNFPKVNFMLFENKGLSCRGNVILKNKNRFPLQQLGHQRICKTFMQISKKCHIKHKASQWVISRAFSKIIFNFLLTKPMAVFRVEYRCTADSRTTILKVTCLCVPLLKRNSLQLNIVKGAVTRYLICSCRSLRWISVAKRGDSNLSLLVTKQHSWNISIVNNRGTVHCLLPLTNLCNHLKFLSIPSCLSWFYLQLVSRRSA